MMSDQPRTSRANGISEAIIIVILIAVAFAIGLLYLLQIRSYPFFRTLPPGTDMVTYDEIARKITGGDFLAGTGTESPLYPRVFLPLVYLATRGDLLFARLVQAALHALIRRDGDLGIRQTILITHADVRREFNSAVTVHRWEDEDRSAAWND